jgi:ABC-2 type transport system ATP-binding protein
MNAPADPASLPAISVRGFGKSYPDIVAVDSLSFDVPAGSILGLLGPNGAGKTTTLRALAGIIPPTHGELHVAGISVTKNPVRAKERLAFVPDDPKLFDLLTVWEHLEFIAAAYRMRDFTGAAEALFDEFQLVDKRNTLAQGLSRGMRQKVAICCAYLHAPSAILLDEPMTGLDPHGIRAFKASILDRARRGAAVIISSHLLSLIEDLCSHLLILHRGRSVFSGAIDEARARYPALQGSATLEEVFFRATDETA